MTLSTTDERPVWDFDGHVIVGADDRVLVIAEIGMNHNGSVGPPRS